MLYTSLRSLRSASVRPRSTIFNPQKPPPKYSCRPYSIENTNQKKQTNIDNVVNRRSPTQSSESEATNSASPASSLDASAFSTLPTSEPIPNASSASPSLDVGPTGPSKEAEMENVKKMIREWTERTAIQVRKQADAYTSKAVKTFSQLGAELNKVTGYEEIETLKKRVVAQGMHERLIIVVEIN